MEDITKFREGLYEPLPGTAPDDVPAEIAQQELNAFMTLNAETRG